MNTTNTETDILKTAVSKMIIKKQNIYPCQFSKGSLNVWESGMFTQLIKDAARCNDYSSDIIYDLNDISNGFQEFNPGNEFPTKYIGFRKLGVDSGNMIRCKLMNGTSIYNEYFAFYTVDVNHEENCFYHVVFTEYSV